MNDRRRGALVGLAVGDALGAAVEFKSPGSFAPVTGYRSGGPHRLDAGEWTDDTSMALALADSIATAGWDVNDQASRYVEWWQTGKYSVNGRCFDIGITTSSALSNYVAKKNALTSGDAPTGQVATARSCGWPPCRSAMSTCIRPRAMSLPDSPRNPVCRRTPATSAYQRAGIWRPFSPP
jgi:ADP-ribosylglycohydrolase